MRDIDKSTTLVTLTPEKPVRLLDRELQLDSKNIASSLPKFIEHAIDLKAGKAFGSLFDVLIKATPDAKHSEFAWTFLFDCFYQAVLKLLSQDQNTSKVEWGKLKKEVSNKVTSFLICDDNLIPITADFFENPLRQPVVINMRNSLSYLFQFSCFSESEIKGLGDDFNEAFILATHKFDKKNSKEIESLKNYFKSDSADILNSMNEWDTYRKSLREEVENTLNDESFSLKDIYVPMSAVELSSEMYRKVHNKHFELHQSLFEWGLDESQVGIKLIGGPSGSGKTSLAKMLSAEWAECGAKVLFVEFKNSCFDSDNLLNAIAKFCHNSGLPYNPLDLKSHREQVILVLDGLDEYVEAHSFPDKLLRNMGEIIENKRLKLFRQIIVTGRETLIRQIQSSFSDTDYASFYMIQPMFQVDSRETDKTYDHRLDWWHKYMALSNSLPQDVFEKLKQSSVYETADRPLINYLIARYSQGNDKKLIDITNVGELYAHIAEKMYAKLGIARLNGCKISKSRPGLDIASFGELIEDIAIDMWHRAKLHNKESLGHQLVSIRQVEKMLKERVESEKFSDEDINTIATKVVEAFLFTQANEGELWGFTHKSFRDYFIAKGMIRLLKEESKLRGEDDRKVVDGLIKWITFFGKTVLDDGIFEMFSQLILIEGQKDTDVWQNIMAEFIQYGLKDGLPMHEIAKVKDSYLMMTLQARNAGIALLLILCQLAYRNQQKAKVDWHDNAAFGEWFKFLQGQREYEAKDLIFNNLKNLDLSKQVLYMQDFCKIDLSDFSFISADLSATNFSQAILNKADLSNAKLNESSFWEADLSKAILTKASFISANLSRIIAHDSKLEEVNFSNANLMNAKLTKVDLTHSNLIDVSLIRANVSDSNLSETDFSRAQFNHCKHHSKPAYICRRLN